MMPLKSTCNDMYDTFPTPEKIILKKENLKKILKNPNMSEEEKCKAQKDFADDWWQLVYPNIKGLSRINTKVEGAIFTKCRSEIIAWELRKTDPTPTNIFGIIKCLREQKGLKTFLEFKNWFNSQR
ncbi:MAG: hypothetical protein ACXWL2_04925 [Candidatus Chromulinivorax sp.]